MIEILVLFKTLLFWSSLQRPNGTLIHKVYEEENEISLKNRIGVGAWEQTTKRGLKTKQEVFMLVTVNNKKLRQ